MFQLYARRCLAYGFDSGGDQGACGRQYRSGKMHKPPCDLTGGYCTSAGSAYPWHAVKRFVQENQGLMRRMYGDQSHGQVLKAEFDDSDNSFKSRKMWAKQQFDFNLDNDLNREGFDARYLKEEDFSNDDVLNTKFVYSEEPSISIKLADLRTAPHFRPATHRSTTTTESTKATITTEETITETETTTIESTTDTTTNQNLKTDTSSKTTNTIITESSTNQEENNKMEETVLFQDMEAEESKNNQKVHVDYQMKGV